MKYDFTDGLIASIACEVDDLDNKNQLFDEVAYKNMESMLWLVNSCHYPELNGLKYLSSSISKDGFVKVTFLNAACEAFYMVLSKNSLLLNDVKENFSIRIGLQTDKFSPKDMLFEIAIPVGKDIYTARETVDRDFSLCCYTNVKDDIKKKNGVPIELVPDYNMLMNCNKEDKGTINYNECGVFAAMDESDHISLDKLRVFMVAYSENCNRRMKELELISKTR